MRSDDLWRNTYDDWLTDAPDPGPVLSVGDEMAREYRWSRFEAECRKFAAQEGWPATLRAVSRAMAAQQELFK